MLQCFLKKSPTDDFTRIDLPQEGCWIHVDHATIEDINHLCSLLELEYFDLKDSLDKYEIPRVEKLSSYVVIYTRHPTDQEVGLYTSTLTLILTKKYFVTISPHRCPFVNQLLLQKSILSTFHKSELLMHLLLKISHEFTQQIKRVRYNVLEQEKDMALVESDDIAILTKSEEILNQYLSALIPLKSVLDEITTGKYTVLDEKNQDLIEDLMLTVKQSEDLCSINLKSIRSLRDSYQIIFANKLHRTIKLLTALTIILSLPTMVASLYGMNVRLPFADSSRAFFYVILMILGLSIVAFWFFQRKKWL